MDIEESNKYRILYEELRGESEQKIDDYIRYLSGGALVLSITFFGDIIPKEGVVFPWSILLGWSFLVLSLISNFVSYYFTINNTNKTISDIDEKKKDWGKSAKVRNKPIKWIGYFSATSTILGIIAITLFVALNINNYG